MEKEVKSSFYGLLFVDILLIAVGLLILFFQVETIKAISYLLGASIAIAGMIGIVRFFMHKDERFSTKYGIVYGIAFIIIACLLLWKDHAIIRVLPFALGMVIIICSALRLDDVMNLRRNHQEIWQVLCFLVLMELLLGGILTFRLFRNVLSVYQEIAVCCIFFGILDIASNWICKLFDCDQKQVIIADTKVAEVMASKPEDTNSEKESDDKQKEVEPKKEKETLTSKPTSKKKPTTTKNTKKQPSKAKKEDIKKPVTKK